MVFWGDTVCGAREECTGVPSRRGRELSWGVSWHVQRRKWWGCSRWGGAPSPRTQTLAWWR